MCNDRLPSGQSICVYDEYVHRFQRQQHIGFKRVGLDMWPVLQGSGPLESKQRITRGQAVAKQKRLLVENVL